MLFESVEFPHLVATDQDYIGLEVLSWSFGVIIEVHLWVSLGIGVPWQKNIELATTNSLVLFVKFIGVCNLVACLIE